MKTNKLFGMLILIVGVMLVFGFAACDDGNGGSGNGGNGDNEGKSGGDVPVTSISITPATAVTLTVGETAPLSASVLPANATNTNVTWSSLNTEFAEVNTSGLVKAVAAGTATIRVAAADGSGVSAEKTVTVRNPVVYVAGYEGDDDDIYAALWKDGVPIRLGAVGSEALSVCATPDGTAYIAGYEMVNSNRVATLWTVAAAKNVTKLALSDAEYSEVSGICQTNDGAVWVCGYEMQPANVAAVWKVAAGVKTAVTISNGMRVDDICAVGSTVYAVGRNDSESRLWTISGTAVTNMLNIEGSDEMEIYGIYARGSTVYLTGCDYDESADESIPVIWTVNGANVSSQFFSIPAGNYGWGNSVYVTPDGAKYVAGVYLYYSDNNYDSTPVLWKNDTQLSLSVDSGEAYGVYGAPDGTVYVCGEAYTDNTPVILWKVTAAGTVSAQSVSLTSGMLWAAAYGVHVR